MKHLLVNRTNSPLAHSDIAVIGGGPAGALVALKLAQAGFKVQLIEARTADAEVQDARALALSWGSYRQLAEAGGWSESLDASMIDSVHVSQQGHWGRTVIQAADLGLPHLGMVLDYPQLSRELEYSLRASGVQVVWGTRVTAVQTLSGYAVLHCQGEQGALSLTTRLTVMADGGGLVDSLPGIQRECYDYQQSALIAQVLTGTPPQTVAYERFSHYGPLALLPHANGYRLVWTRPKAEVEALLADGASCLQRQLTEVLADRLGSIIALKPLAVFPLVLRRARQVIGPRQVLIGNAAQTIHPVAAQGLNLAIRDASALAQVLQGRKDPGDEAGLRHYRHLRRWDSRGVIGFTHGLMRLFEVDRPGAAWMRGLGMNLLDCVPPLRKRFAGHLVSGLGAQR